MDTGERREARATGRETRAASGARPNKAETPASPVRQAAAALPPVAIGRADAPASLARSEATSRPTAAQGSSPSSARERASAERPSAERPSAERPSAERGAAAQGTSAAAAAPISFAVSLSASAGRLEILPVEAVADLRERLAHGKEKAEFGEYASARRIYGAALERINDLGSRYTATQSLAAVKQELEQASARALASCAAENDVIRRRSGKVLSCD